MNSTKWSTLTTFVKYLGKTSKCIVDETEKVGSGVDDPLMGFFIKKLMQLLDRPRYYHDDNGNLTCAPVVVTELDDEDNPFS